SFAMSWVEHRASFSAQLARSSPPNLNRCSDFGSKTADRRLPPPCSTATAAFVEVDPDKASKKPAPRVAEAGEPQDPNPPAHPLRLLDLEEPLEVNAGADSTTAAPQSLTTVEAASSSDHGSTAGLPSTVDPSPDATTAQPSLEPASPAPASRAQAAIGQSSDGAVTSASAKETPTAGEDDPAGSSPPSQPAQSQASPSRPAASRAKTP